MKPPKKNLKRILMIATGGTIASKRSEDGLKPLITSEELLGYVPDVKEFCEVTAMQVINIDSTNIQPKHWLLISSTIEKYYDQFDGFVVCHGTDTMAYTASALSYLIQNSPKPIVITGAQKPIDLEITDAKTNLSVSTLSLTVKSLPVPAAKRNAPKATMPFPALTFLTLLRSRTTTLSSISTIKTV